MSYQNLTLCINEFERINPINSLGIQDFSYGDLLRYIHHYLNLRMTFRVPECIYYLNRGCNKRCCFSHR
jgi:hypothetical protein